MSARCTMNTIKNYFLEQITTPSTWYGLVGLGLMLLGFSGAFVLLAMVFVPDTWISKMIAYLTDTGAKKVTQTVEDVTNALD